MLILAHLIHVFNCGILSIAPIHLMLGCDLKNSELINVYLFQDVKHMVIRFLMTENKELIFQKKEQL